MSFDYNAIEQFLSEYNDDTGKFSLEILRNEENIATNFIFTNSGKIVNLISRYDPVSLISEFIENLDKEDSILDYVFSNSIKLFSYNSFDVNLDYLITGNTVYLPIYGLNNHSMDLILESFSQYIEQPQNLTIAQLDTSGCNANSLCMFNVKSQSNMGVLTVDFGDGTIQDFVLNDTDFNITHRYETAGVYSITATSDTLSVVYEITVSAQSSTSALDDKMIILDYTDGGDKDRNILAFYSDKSCKLTTVTLNTDAYPDDPRLFTQDCQWSASQTLLQLKYADVDENVTVPLDNGLITQNQMDENETLIGLYDIEQVNLSDMENRYFELYMEPDTDDAMQVFKFYPNNVFKSYVDGILDSEAIWSVNGNDLILSQEGTEIASIQSHNSVFKMGKVTTFDLPSGESYKMVIAKIGIIEEEQNGSAPEVLWDRTFGGSKIDRFKGVAIDNNDNIYVVGNTFSDDIDGTNDALIIKYDNNGTEIWSKIIGGNNSDAFSGITIDDIGNLYVIGSTNSLEGDIVKKRLTNNSTEALVVKLDNDGTILWYDSTAHAFGSSFNSIAIDDNGNIYAVGSIRQLNPSYNMRARAMIVKFDNAGLKLWDKNIGSDNGNDIFYSVSIGNGGNIYAVGKTTSIDGDITSGNNGGRDAFIVKLDSSGTKLWDETIGGSSEDVFTSIIADTSGNIYAVGYTKSKDFDITDKSSNVYDSLIVKLDSSGTRLWIKTNSYIGAQNLLYDIKFDNSGNFYVVGSIVHVSYGDPDTDSLIIKFDSDGKKLWDKKVGGSNRDYFYSIAIDNNKNIYAVGNAESSDGDITDGNNGEEDAFVVKLR